tara:strand:+ start:2291 stop:2509 length:219 start_codon:yes stop_codon:yes gene_type:complete
MKFFAFEVETQTSLHLEVNERRDLCKRRYERLCQDLDDEVEESRIGSVVASDVVSARNEVLAGNWLDHSGDA